MMAKSKVAMTTLAVLVAVLVSAPAEAQNFPITPAQRATATQVAQAGVPLSELSPNAPDHYTVVRGDTLWAISGMFLKHPWRWPELWGMNLEDIRNPHLIYPGQKLYLEKKDGRATLRIRASADGEAPTDTVRVSPRTRVENLANDALPTLKSHLFEPFLEGPVILDEGGLQSAPRIVGAAEEGRVVFARGDRLYARGQGGDTTLLFKPGEKQPAFRVFRDPTPLYDPVTREVLGYEAHYLGKALLARGESIQDFRDSNGNERPYPVPATVDVTVAKEEMRIGDRLLPEPERLFQSYVPRAPRVKVDARIVSVYGNAVANAGQSQVVVINRGTRDGVEIGDVLAILTEGARYVDTTAEARDEIQLPDERNGLLIVFRTFEKLSYGLILEIRRGVTVGDRLVNPR